MPIEGQEEGHTVKLRFASLCIAFVSSKDKMNWDNSWVSGGDASVKAVQKIGVGGYGEVYKVIQS